MPRSLPTVVATLSIDDAKNLALVITLSLAVLAVVAMMVVRAVMAKVITIAVLAALAFGVWTQRDELKTCADRVRAQIDAGLDTRVTTCTFFGKKLTVG